MMPILEETVELWSSVREENARDRALVTESDWATWERVDREVTDNLVSIVHRSSDGISNADEAKLRTISTRVANATRRTGATLEDYARTHGVINDTKTSKKERKRLLALLGR